MNITSIQLLLLSLALFCLSVPVQAAPCERQVSTLRMCLDAKCPGRPCMDAFEPTSDCEEFNARAAHLFCCSRCYTETQNVAQCLKQGVPQSTRARDMEVQQNVIDSCVTTWPRCVDTGCPSTLTPLDPCLNELTGYQYCPDFYLDDCVECPIDTVSMLADAEEDSCEALNVKQCTLQNCCEPCGRKLKALSACRATNMETECSLVEECQPDNTDPEEEVQVPLPPEEPVVNAARSQEESGAVAKSIGSTGILVTTAITSIMGVVLMSSAW